MVQNARSWSLHLICSKRWARCASAAIFWDTFLAGAVIGKYFGALFCIIGHMFPVFYGFKGGKGILCSGTLLLLLDWRIALVGWGVFVVLWLTTRYVSLGSVAAAISFPITTQLVFRDWGLYRTGHVHRTACAVGAPQQHQTAAERHRE